MRPYYPGGILNALASPRGTPRQPIASRVRITDRFPTASIHLLGLGLPGSPIRFAPPAFVLLGVRNSPESCLRHRRSSRYQPISPVHREFRSPLLSSSRTVLRAVLRLSLRISPATYPAAVAPFTPSESGQRSRPTSDSRLLRRSWSALSPAVLSVFIPP